MACASKNSGKKKTKLSKKDGLDVSEWMDCYCSSDSDDDDLLIDCMGIGNLHGIKEGGLWDSIKKLNYHYPCTYFILPESDRKRILAFVIRELERPIDTKDFVRFWSNLDDQHKERRLLVDYTAAIRGIDASLVGSTSQKVVKIIKMMASDILLLLDDILIKNQGESEFEAKLHRLLNVSIVLGDNGPDLLMDIFMDPLRKAMDKLEMQEACAACLIKPVFRSLLIATTLGFVFTYCGWASEDRMNFKRFAAPFFCPQFIIDWNPGEIQTSAQKKYLAKLRVAVPHWCQKDRAILLKMIENGSGLSSYPYVQKLYLELEPKRFKMLVFGEEKFCSNCGRSSYVGKDRLWSCKRCVEEGVRPKARYCNVACQKAHWIKHKAEDHSGKAPKKVMVESNKCTTCGRKSQLRACKRCTDEGVFPRARYCNVECQSKHWPVHKEEAHSTQVDPLISMIERAFSEIMTKEKK